MTAAEVANDKQSLYSLVIFTYTHNKAAQLITFYMRRWLDYTAIGEKIEGVPIRACKVPLKQVRAYISFNYI